MSDAEVTVSEMNESFDIKQRMRRETGWVKDFELVNGARMLFGGRLHWNEDEGYEIFWDGKKPEMADRPEFEYVLDSILEDKYNG
jgi:hypothetical protein